MELQVVFLNAFKFNSKKNGETFHKLNYIMFDKENISNTTNAKGIFPYEAFISQELYETCRSDMAMELVKLTLEDTSNSRNPLKATKRITKIEKIQK